MRSGARRGAASIEVIAAIPAFAVVALMGWYAATAVVAAIDVQEELRRRGLERIDGADAPHRSGVTTIHARRSVGPLPTFPRVTVHGTVAVPAP